MLFDVNPKEKVSDLYDRKKQLAALEASVKHGEKLSIVYGMRRVGKTSLIRAFLSQKEMPYVLIDARQIYMEHASVPKGALYELVSNEFLDFALRFGGETDDSLSRKYPTMFSSKEFTALLKDINEWCKERRVIYAIVFDEAQYLRFGGSVRYDLLLAWSIDNLSNIAYFLTGSEVGMLKDFLKYEDADAPLYGRFRNEIFLEKFGKRTAEDFLAKGFKETGRKVGKKEIEKAVAAVGGIVGWLTYYGHYRGVLGLSQENALKKVSDEGSKIVIKEIERLIAKSRERYLSILGAVAAGHGSWANIKRYIVAEKGAISDMRLNALLQSLVKFGIIEKTKEDTYFVMDPIVAYAVRKIAR